MAPIQSKPLFNNQVASRFASNSVYSDITLRFSGTEMPAHRIVLASQSGWFAQQLEVEGPLKEVERPVIDLGDEDDPDLLTVLIKYLYTRSYPSLISTTDPDEPKAHICLRHLRLYVMATDYRVPCVQAAAAKRVKEYMADLYGVSVDLLTDFIPFMYGDSLTPKPLNKDEHGLRRFIAERAALDHLERVEACEMDRYIAEYPDFAVDYLTASWNLRTTQIEENRLKGIFCRACNYSMEISVNYRENVADRNLRVCMRRPSGKGGVKLEEMEEDVPIKTCPNCQGAMEMQHLI
ncbi:hypothetical protein SLS57_007564 [Botryosphaeria dothidea]